MRVILLLVNYVRIWGFKGRWYSENEEKNLYFPYAISWEEVSDNGEIFYIDKAVILMNRLIYGCEVLSHVSFSLQEEVPHVEKIFLLLDFGNLY